jgi:NAD(P)-dependent dehydrogenase (short-subunit alcohol dehydrogenase family)
MNIELRGCSALITGSTAGIGFAIAKGIAELGQSDCSVMTKPQ